MCFGSVFIEEFRHSFAQVGGGGLFVVEAGGGLAHDAGQLAGTFFRRSGVETQRLAHRPLETLGIEMPEQESVAGVRGGVEVIHGGVQAAGCSRSQ